MSKLSELATEYQSLLERKDDLEEMVKENKAAIEAKKEQIIQQMVDDEMQKISTGGYTFTLQNKVAYRKRSENDLAKNGADFFGVLREEGLGDIIKETVSAQTLQSSIRSYVEEHGELSEALDTVISAYEYQDIMRRKDARR